MTRKEEDRELIKSMLPSGNYNFKHGETSASNDRVILNKWNDKKISTTQAAKKICKANDWIGMNSKEFTIMAHSLGYIRGDISDMEGGNYYD